MANSCNPPYPHSHIRMIFITRQVDTSVTITPSPLPQKIPSCHTKEPSLFSPSSLFLPSSFPTNTKTPTKLLSTTFILIAAQPVTSQSLLNSPFKESAVSANSCLIPPKTHQIPVATIPHAGWAPSTPNISAVFPNPLSLAPPTSTTVVTPRAYTPPAAPLTSTSPTTNKENDARTQTNLAQNKKKPCFLYRTRQKKTKKAVLSPLST